MNVKLSQSEFCLFPRQTLSFADAAGVRIDAGAGTVWVTQDHDLRDVVLQTGESYTLQSNGQTIVQAFEASRVRLSAPAVATRRGGIAHWVARVIGAFRPTPSTTTAWA